MATMTGAFRGQQSAPSAPGGGELGLVNLADFTAGGWTPGCTLIDRLPIQAPLAPSWSITGWTIACYLWLAQGPGGPRSGRLGKLLGGLVPSANSTFTSNTIPYQNPGVPLPPDISMFADIWDGSVDPAPPSIAVPLPPSSIVSSSLQLPVPLPLSSGDQLSLGLWLTPSVVNNVSLIVANATWAVTYTDPSRTSGLWT